MNNSSSNGSTGPNCPSIVYAVDRGVLYVCAVVVFLVVIFGLFGNILSFLVLRYSRGSSANVYLRCLAIADSLSLVFAVTYTSGSMIFRPLAGKHSAFAHLMQTWYLCQAFLYLSFATRMISIYIIVVFTLERLATVFRPLFGSAFFTPQKAKVSIAVVVAVSMVLNLPMLLAMDKKLNRTSGVMICRVNDLFHHMKLFAYAAITALPCAVVGGCNVAIGVLMRRRHKDRLQMMSDANAALRSKKIARRAVRRIMVVSISFFILSLPNLVYTTFSAIERYVFKAPCPVRKSTSRSNTLVLCLTLFFCNFGINFALYCLTGRQFRLAALAILRCDHATLKRLTLFLHENVQTPAATPSNSRQTSETALCRDRVLRTPLDSGDMNRLNELAHLNVIHEHGAASGVCELSAHTPT